MPTRFYFSMSVIILVQDELMCNELALKTTDDILKKSILISMYQS